MKRPTPASLKRVTPENLARLGSDRLAQLLAEVADTRPELKRRLRMELAAEQGAEHLLPEIDRRLATVEASRSRVSWRQRPAFARDLDALRDLIAGRLSGLDPDAARDRILRFMTLGPRAQLRVRDAEGAVAAVFERAAGDVGRLFAAPPAAEAGATLAAAVAEAPGPWGRWAPATFSASGQGLAQALLRHIRTRTGPAWRPLLRATADAAGDPVAFAAAFSPDELGVPAVAAEAARRFIAAGQLEPARATLEAAVKPGLFRRGRSGAAEPDFAWESVWIEYLEAAGQEEAAQEARWASFGRTLSLERGRAITARLPDFEDVEAEQRLFEIATSHPDPDRALALLMAWPALPEAADLVEKRAGELDASPAELERWAASLRRRFPGAAQALLRRAAALAHRRRDYEASARLIEEAEAIHL